MEYPTNFAPDEKRKRLSLACLFSGHVYVHAYPSGRIRYYLFSCKRCKNWIPVNPFSGDTVLRCLFFGHRMQKPKGPKLLIGIERPYCSDCHRNETEKTDPNVKIL